MEGEAGGSPPGRTALPQGILPAVGAGSRSACSRSALRTFSPTELLALGARLGVRPEGWNERNGLEGFQADAQG